MLGVLAALGCALCWAISARIYRQVGASFSALTINFWKGLVALSGLSIISSLLSSQYWLSDTQLMLLLASGALGIGIGDTFFFIALKKLGDSNTLFLTETTAPLLTALIAIVWLTEWLTPIQWGAIALVIMAVAMVIKFQSRQAKPICMQGFICASIAALCQAIGAVVSRGIFTNQTAQIDALDASIIRIIGALLVIVPLILVRKEHWLPKSDHPTRCFLTLMAASVIGMLMGMYLMMLSFSLTKAAIAQTLFTSSVIMSFIIAFVFGERYKKRIYAAVLIAVLGVALIV